MNNKLAIVFPGQGSQAVGMLKELAAAFNQTQSTFIEASQILGYDLWDLAQNGPEEKLSQTEITQPALLTAGVAVWRIWQEKNNILPVFMAGHSLGEYTALVCAGAITFADALLLVRDRGRFMQESCQCESAMVAIVGLDDNTVRQICSEAAQGEVLVPANYNSIGQIVIAGQLGAAKRATELAKKANAKITKILPVSVPSHCMLMQQASEQLSKRLLQLIITPPKISVIHNADVACYSDPNKICDALIRQLYSPVRWVETVQFMISSGIKCILECGSGKVLTGLNKRISKEIITDSIGEPEKIKEMCYVITK
jgi:[acyl-carrier-protein] S-malonyltransferase